MCYNKMRLVIWKYLISSKVLFIQKLLIVNKEYQQRAFGIIKQGRFILAEMIEEFMEQVVFKAEH